MKYLVQNIQSSIGDIPHRVLKCPDNRIENEFELCWRNIQECSETVLVDSFQEFVEMRAMLRIILEILVYHVQCTFEDSVKYIEDFTGDVVL